MKTSQISPVSLEREALSIQIPPVRLSSGPRTFSKLLKPAVALLRRLGVRLLIFLDDIILLNQDKTALITDRNSTLWLLQKLGFVINWGKSVLTSRQRIQYLGYMLDSRTMTLAFPEEKIMGIQAKWRDLLMMETVSVRQLSELIGTLTASVMAVLTVPLHYRQLQMLKSKGLLIGGQNYNTKIQLTPMAIMEMRCWIHYLGQSNGKAIITPAPDLIITTDSSMKGWGAICNGVTTQGLWNTQERK